ncbi:MAG: hypothetical protein QM723_15815 [Myxococcaceae bacterium]
MKRALLVLLLAACEPVDFVVAHVPDGGDFMGKPCTDNSDCQEHEFCSKKACGDLQGTCNVRDCPGNDQYQPVCGCNGVTYWNDCLRRLDGANLRADEQCEAAKSCNNAIDCSPGPFAACARVSQLSCPSTGATGTCWAVPPHCPQGQSTSVQVCSSNACTDLCGAIKSQEPALVKTSCP